MNDPNGFFVSENKTVIFRQFVLPVPIDALIALYGEPEGPQVGVYAPTVIYDQSASGVSGRLSALAQFDDDTNPYVVGTKTVSRDTVIFKHPLYEDIVPEPMPEEDGMTGFGGNTVTSFSGAPIVPFNQ